MTEKRKFGLSTELINVNWLKKNGLLSRHFGFVKLSSLNCFPDTYLKIAIKLSSIFALYKENFALLEYTGLFMLPLCVYTDLNSQSSNHGHIFTDQTNWLHSSIHCYI